MNKVYVLSITFVATLGGFLFGYDTAVISGAIGPLEKYFSLTPTEVGFAASSALLGCALGAILAGAITHYCGRKFTLMIAAIFFGVSAIGTALPKIFLMFVMFRILGGVGIGLASMVSPMYIAEVSPPLWRGRLVSLNQFAIVIGILSVYIANYFIAQRGDEAWLLHSGWRWMLACEFIPALFFLFLLLFIPESPRWLMMKDRSTYALAILTKINGVHSAQQELAQIHNSCDETVDKKINLFTKPYRTIVFVGVMLAILQQTTGINVFLYYAPEIFKDFSKGADSALWQTVLIGMVNVIFTIFAFFTIDKWGRKPLMIIGSAGMALCLFVVGFGVYQNNLGSWLVGYVLAYVGFFAMSMGPVMWVLLSEIFPNAVRAKALAIAVFAQWMANYAISQSFPMMNANMFLQEKFNGAFPFWLYGAMCIATIVFTIIHIPETKGRELEEIESHWFKGACANSSCKQIMQRQ